MPNAAPSDQLLGSKYAVGKITAFPVNDWDGAAITGGGNQEEGAGGGVFFGPVNDKSLHNLPSWSPALLLTESLCLSVRASLCPSVPCPPSFLP